MRVVGLTLLVFLSTVKADAIYVPSVYMASFGDGLKVDKYKTGYYSTYKDADNYSGYEYSRNQFSLADWHAAGEQVSFVTKDRNASGMTRSLTVGYNTLDTSNALWTADASISTKLTASTTGELTFNRDRVEVQQSLATNVFANSYGGSIEQQVVDAARVQLTYGETRYTDGNRRPLLKVKATYDVLPEHGVNLQFRGRYFRNTDTSVNSGYFNPYKFVENIVALEVNQTRGGWALSGNVGYGRQAGGNDPLTLAKAFEFSATTPMTNRIFVRTKAGYFRSLGYNGPDFIYRYVSEDVIVMF